MTTKSMINVLADAKLDNTKVELNSSADDALITINGHEPLTLTSLLDAYAGIVRIFPIITPFKAALEQTWKDQKAEARKAAQAEKSAASAEAKAAKKAKHAEEMAAKKAAREAAAAEKKAAKEAEKAKAAAEREKNAEADKASREAERAKAQQARDTEAKRIAAMISKVRAGDAGKPVKPTKKSKK